VPTGTRTSAATLASVQRQTVRRAGMGSSREWNADGAPRRGAQTRWRAPVF
jgi:hypothetical protein